MTSLRNAAPRFRRAALRLARCAAGALALLAVSTRQAAPQHPLVTLPLDDPAYQTLESLDQLGCAEARVSPYRPFATADVRRALRRARNRPRCQGPLLDALVARFGEPRPVPADSMRGVAADLAAVAAVQPVDSTVDEAYIGAAATVGLTSLSRGEFRPLWRGVRSTDSGTAPAVAQLRVRGVVPIGAPIVIVAEGYAQTSRRNDPLIRAQGLRRTSGVVDFSEAYATGALGRFRLSLGRAPEAWLGEGSESIALSANGPPLDRILATAHWAKVEARALVATLNDVTLDTLRDSLASGTPPQRFTRLLIAHALAFRPSSGAEFTLGETAILSRQTKIFDLAYLNPLMEYLVVQNGVAENEVAQQDNLNIFASTNLHAGPARLIGELFVDDFQIDRLDRQTIPDQLAWRLDASTPVPLPLPASVGVEYRHVNSYTYLRRFYPAVYQQFDRPLGSELGPDADMLRGRGEFWLGGEARIAGGLGVWRQGALRIDQRPSQQASGNAGYPFPRVTPSLPAVQRALLGDISAQILAVGHPITLRVEAARIEKAGNVYAATALYVRTQLIGTYAFRYP